MHARPALAGCTRGGCCQEHTSHHSCHRTAPHTRSPRELRGAGQLHCLNGDCSRSRLPTSKPLPACRHPPQLTFAVKKQLNNNRWYSSYRDSHLLLIYYDYYHHHVAYVTQPHTHIWRGCPTEVGIPHGESFLALSFAYPLFYSLQSRQSYPTQLQDS